MASEPASSAEPSHTTDIASVLPAARGTRSALVWVAALSLVAAAAVVGLLYLRVHQRAAYLGARHARIAAAVADRVRGAIEANATAVAQAARAALFVATNGGAYSPSTDANGAREVFKAFHDEFEAQTAASQLAPVEWSAAARCDTTGTSGDPAPGELTIRFCPQPTRSLQTTNRQAPVWPVGSQHDVTPSSDRLVYCYRPDARVSPTPLCVARSIDSIMRVSGAPMDALDVFLVDDTGTLRFGEFHSSVRLLRLERSSSSDEGPPRKDAAKPAQANAHGDTGWPSVEGVMVRSQRAKIRQGHESFQLLTEPFGIPTRIAVGPDLAKDMPLARHRLAVGILLRSDAFSSQAAAISLSSTRLLLVALVALVFVPPVVKVWMSGSRERFRPIEIYFIFVAITAITGFTTIWLLHLATSAAMSRSDDEAMQRTARRIGDDLAKHIRDDARALTAFVNGRARSRADLDLTADHFVGCHTTSASDRTPQCGIGWVASGDAAPSEPTKQDLTLPAQYAGLPEEAMLVVIADDRGRQLEKWSKNPVITWQVGMETFSSFADVKGSAPGGTASLLDESSQPFAFNVQESPNTGHVIYLVSVPIHAPDRSIEHAPTVGVASVRLPSFAGGLPQGVSFAVVERNGSVLMHEDPSRPLHENFLEESDASSSLAAALVAKPGTFVDADYHGIPHRMYVSSAAPLPFSVVVFRQAEAMTTPLIEAALIAASAFLLLGALWLVPLTSFATIFGSRGHAWLWPDRISPGRYVPLLVSLVLIGLLEIKAMATRDGIVAVGAIFACGLLALTLAFLLLDRRSLPRRAPMPIVDLLPSAVSRWVRIPVRFVTWRRAACLSWAALAVWLYLSTARNSAELRSALLGLGAIVAAAVVGKGTSRNPKGTARAQSSDGARVAAIRRHRYVSTGAVMLLVLGVIPAVALYRDAFDDSMERVAARCQERALTAPASDWGLEASRHRGSCDEIRRQIGLTATDGGQQASSVEVEEPRAASPGLVVMDQLRWADRVLAAAAIDAARLFRIAPSPDPGASDACGPDAPWACRLAWHLKHWFPIVSENSAELRNMPGLGARPFASVYARSISPLGTTVAIALMLAVIVWAIREIATRVFGIDVPARPERDNPSALEPRGDLLIGPTKAELDAYRARAPRSRRTTREIDCSRFATPESFEALEGAAPDLDRARVVWLHRFDYLINDARWNRARFAALERLLGDERRRVVLVCEIDPLEYIHRRLRSQSDPATVGRFATGDELDRWARILMQVRKLWLSEHELARRDHRSTWHRAWGLTGTLNQETRCTPALRAIRDLLLDLPPRVRLEKADFVARIEELARTHYRVIWSECSDDEKMLLWRLSYDGFIAPRSWRVAKRLLRRGLLRLSPNLRLMNDSFGVFVRQVEPWREIRRWQDAGDPSPWRSLRPMFIVGLLTVGVALYAAQPDEIGRWMGLITAAAGGLGTLTQVLALARGSRTADVEAAATRSA